MCTEFKQAHQQVLNTLRLYSLMQQNHSNINSLLNALVGTLITIIHIQHRPK
jgi:hypothetical protein